jgi:hypothetical protein
MMVVNVGTDDGEHEIVISGEWFKMQEQAAHIFLMITRLSYAPSFHAQCCVFRWKFLMAISKVMNAPAH